MSVKIPIYIVVKSLILVMLCIGCGYGKDCSPSGAAATNLRNISRSSMEISNHGDEDADKNCKLSNMLSGLFNGYDKRIRPYRYDGKPVTIVLGVWILSIDSINIINMDYRIDFFMRQSWTDPRLANCHEKTLTISNSVLDKIWIPDTYVQNSKESEFHYVTSPNKMFSLSPNGTVMFNARISVRAFCPMDLRWFPVDSQQCVLHIESYSFNTLDIKYEWEDHEDRLKISKKAQELPHYNLIQFGTNATEQIYYGAGNWSGLQIAFVMQRKYGHFFLHLYAPSLMLVVLSWINFFIPIQAVAARIGLSITAVLVVVTLLHAQDKILPKVSYLKLVDWYLIICFAFIATIFIEYTTILHLNKIEIEKEKENKQKGKKNKQANNDCKVHTNTINPKTTISMLTTPVIPQSNRTPLPREPGVYYQKPVLRLVQSQSITPPRDEVSLVEDDVIPRTVEPSFFNYFKIFQCTCNEFRPEMIDEYSRILFPVAFTLFNVIYWYIFFSNKHDVNHNVGVYA